MDEKIYSDFFFYVIKKCRWPNEIPLIFNRCVFIKTNTEALVHINLLSYELLVFFAQFIGIAENGLFHSIASMWNNHTPGTEASSNFRTFSDGMKRNVVFGSHASERMSWVLKLRLKKTFD